MNSIIKLKSDFHSNGFVVIKNLFSKNEISKILKESEKLVKKIVIQKNRYFHKTKDNKINTIHNIQKFYKKNYLVTFSKKKKLIKLVQSLWGEKCAMRNIELFFKPKKTGMKAPFHQDNFYWNIVDAKALNVWIACSSASSKNGGLIYLKESHKLGTLNHEISFSPGSSQKIPEKILSKLKFKQICPKIKSGDCIIHHPEVIHGSKKNTSEIDRKALVISYKSINAKYDEIKLKKYTKSLKKNLKKIYK